MVATEPAPVAVVPNRRRAAAFGRMVAAVDPSRLLGALLFVGLWMAATLVLPPIILPTPLGVVARVGADFWSAPALAYYGVSEANLYGNLIYTTENVVIAILCGGVIGILGGLTSARMPVLRAMVDPIMMTAGTVPILVAAPFLLIWFGVGRTSAVCLVIFYVTVILYVSAQRAARNLDPIYEDSARAFGVGRQGLVFDILVPATVPEILGGLRIALAGAWGLEAIAELLGSQSGMGKVLEVLAGATDPQGIMASLLVLGATAMLADAVLGLVVARLAQWRA